MKASTVRPGQLGEWLTVHEACALIGVSPATLRRWSNAGEVRAYTTPGGHRRFARSTILALLPASRQERPSLESLGETAEHVMRACRRRLPTVRQDVVWLGGLDAAARAPLRDHGRTIATALLNSLDAPSPQERRQSLRAAAASAAKCARIAAASGIGRDGVVEAFLRFRMIFLDELAEIARRREFDTTESTDLVMTAAKAFDELLLGLLRDVEWGTS